MIERYKKKWIKALRSGEYKQGKSSLCSKGKNGDFFSCLGVLADILPKYMCDWRTHKDKPVMVYKSLTNHMIFVIENSYIPSKITDKIELAYKDQNILMNMNDSIGNDFNEIADYIEEKL